MTAKEIIDEYKPSKISGSHFERYGQVAIQKMMKEYAKAKCKEQREICNKEFGKIGYYPNSEKAILNAPEPEFY